MKLLRNQIESRHSGSWFSETGRGNKPALRFGSCALHRPLRHREAPTQWGHRDTAETATVTDVRLEAQQPNKEDRTLSTSPPKSKSRIQSSPRSLRSEETRETPPVSVRGRCCVSLECYGHRSPSVSHWKCASSYTRFFLFCICQERHQLVSGNSTLEVLELVLFLSFP